MSASEILLPVHATSKRYDIHIGGGLSARADELLVPHIKSKRCFVITDSNVAAHYLQPLQTRLESAGVTVIPHVLEPGEASKSLAVLEHLLNTVLNARPERGDTLIALGGGVVGDITGFAASIILRGVPFIQIPTTLLSQVDSSVGGKTGINSPAGKNLIGAFYQPETVIIDTDTLNTLPARELRAGYAEVVKYGMIRDAAFFAWLEENGAAVLSRDARVLTHAIHRCCAIKAETVAEDEKEQGVRALLNFGHTFGHAFEKDCFANGDLLHGEAVSFGMVMAAQLSIALGFAAPDIRARLETHLHAHGLPVSAEAFSRTDAQTILNYMYGDKKVSGGALRFVLCDAIGSARVETVTDTRAICAAIMLRNT